MTATEFTPLDKISAIKHLRKVLRTGLVQSKKIVEWIDENYPEGVCLATLGDFVELYDANTLIFYNDVLYKKVQ